MKTLSIGQLAEASGSSIPTIRYYEAIGLLPKAKRAANGHRYYGNQDVDSLRFLRQCRAFGFSIEQTQELYILKQQEAPNCDEALDIVRPHIRSLREKIEELTQLHETLVAYEASCQT